MELLQKNSIKIIGAVVGIASGYAYYLIKGCDSGCMIWSSPWLSSLVGGFLGFMLTDVILDLLSKNKKK